MLTLILGGARSGKSDFAQRLASVAHDVAFVATMEPRDDEVRLRIAAHRRARPPAWLTIEEPRDLIRALDSVAGGETLVLIDCLTMWVANLLLDRLPDPDAATPADASAAMDAITEAARAMTARIEGPARDVIVVSNEVGLGVVPPYPLGRDFRDALGSVNQIVAGSADRVYYLVAGLALELKSLGAQPIESFGKGSPG